MAATPRYDVHADVNTDPIDVRKLPVDAHAERVTRRDPQAQRPLHSICRQCEMPLPPGERPIGGLCDRCHAELEAERPAASPEDEAMICKGCGRGVPGRADPTGLCGQCRAAKFNAPPPPVPVGAGPAASPKPDNHVAEPSKKVATAPQPPKPLPAAPPATRSAEPLTTTQKLLAQELRDARQRCQDEMQRLQGVVLAIDVVLEMYR